MLFALLSTNLERDVSGVLEDDVPLNDTISCCQRQGTVRAFALHLIRAATSEDSAVELWGFAPERWRWCTRTRVEGKGSPQRSKGALES